MNRMPRKSSPSMTEKKITTMPQIIDNKKNLPAIIPQSPSFLQTMKEGFGLGIGSALGRRAVDSIFGSVPVAAPVAAPISEKEFDKCMQRYDDRDLCKELYSLN